MQLPPSDIHFLRDYSALVLPPPPDSARAPTKLQVSQRNGTWFSLDNGQLHVCRELERRGRCRTITVDVVPLSKVPRCVQDSMVRTPDVRPTGSDSLRKDNALSGGGGGGGGGGGDLLELSEQCESELEEADGGSLDGPGLISKRGYQKLPPVGPGEGTPPPHHPTRLVPDTLSEETTTEATYSSFSGTDCSDEDGPVAAADSDSDEDEDDEDEDESLTCNVCDRAFPCTRQLAAHQQRKRHYGCSVCDSIFPSLEILRLHKETLEHWSDDDEDDDDDGDCDDMPHEEAHSVAGGGRRADRSDTEDSDGDAGDAHSPTEELERLL